MSSWFDPDMYIMLILFIIFICLHSSHVMIQCRHVCYVTFLYNFYIFLTFSSPCRYDSMHWHVCDVTFHYHLYFMFHDLHVVIIKCLHVCCVISFIISIFFYITYCCASWLDHDMYIMLILFIISIFLHSLHVMIRFWHVLCFAFLYYFSFSKLSLVHVVMIRYNNMYVMLFFIISIFFNITYLLLMFDASMYVVLLLFFVYILFFITYMSS
jgi:hypothetical protein